MMKQITQPNITGKSIIKVLGIWLGLGGVIGTAGWFGLNASLPDTWSSAAVPTLFAVAAGYSLLPVAMIMVYGWAGMRDKLRLRFTESRDIWLALGVGAATLATILLLYTSFGALSGSVWQPGLELIRSATDMSRFADANAVSWALIVIRVFFLVGIAEELLFRGLLFGWLRGRHSANVTILVTSLIFTIEHYYLVIFPAAFLAGLAAGWLRERTGSVLPCIVLHIFLDATLFFAALALA